MKQINVNLKERTYPIYIGQGISKNIAEVLSQHRISKQVVVVTDFNVAKHHLEYFESNLKKSGYRVHTIIIPPGERQKSWQRLTHMLTEMVKLKLSRNSAVIAFGGGVVGDLAGFAAATYKRGIDFIQIPTTLLSQLDSSIGGKVAVNFLENKNIIGAFHQPKLVMSDVNFLRTLPKREIIGGIGEMLKYGLIGGKETFVFLFKNLTEIKNINYQVFEDAIFRCATVKAKMVSDDERELSEKAGRVPLNLGHAVGHALEMLSNYRLRHGEAVFLGLRVEAEISFKMGFLNGDEYKTLSEYLNIIPYNPKLSYINIDSLVKYFDPEKGGAKPRFVFPENLFSIKVIDKVPLNILRSALKKIISF